MNCPETQQLLHGYVDGELDLRNHLEVEQHLHDCPACAQAHRALQATRDMISAEDLRFEPPPDLRDRVLAALPGPAPIGRGPRPLRQLWPALAASLLVGVMIGGGLVRFFAPQPAGALLAEELLASHVRSQLLPEHRVDVASSDRHTVKPWFAGKLDFSPPVPDLAAEGFALIGGRLDYLDHRTVAALVYQRRQHLINVFLWPSTPDAAAAPRTLSRQGYHLLSWTHSGMTYHAVSDLNETELHDFVELLQTRVPQQDVGATP